MDLDADSDEAGAEPAREIRAAARLLIAAALPTLHELRLFPPPRSNPFIGVGHEYVGSDLSMPEHAALTAAIDRAHPRFRSDAELGERDFASSYTYPFVEACVTRLTFADDPWDLTGPAIDDSVEELVASVMADAWSVACCRVVSHLRTVDGKPWVLDDLEVIPITGGPSSHGHRVHEVINSVITGSGVAMRRSEAADMFAPPEAVIVARTVDPKPFQVVDEMSKRIAQLLLAARLLHAGTAQAMYEVRGETTLVRRYRPALHLFNGEVGSMSRTQMVRRDVVLGPDDQERIRGLQELIERANEHRPEMIVTSFALAVQRHEMSYHAASPYDQIVDLMTALEGTMGGSSKSDVLLRLRTRCAALLATERDPAATIFKDVGILYDLRSTLVHSGDMTTKKLLKLFGSVSGVPAGAMFGEAFGHTVDRLRDLVRRSLLARVCLASGDEPLWPIESDVGVDATLSDDDGRLRWRLAWHEALEAFGAGSSADRPPAAKSSLTGFTEPS